MKKIVLCTFCCLLLAALSFCTTYAYLKPTTSITNKFAVGKDEISLDEEFTSPDKIEKGAIVTKKPKVTNEGDFPCVVRMRVVLSDNDAKCEFNGLDTDNWYEIGDFYYYQKILQPNETTEPLFQSVSIPSDVPDANLIPFSIYVYPESKLAVDLYNTYSEGKITTDALKDIWLINKALN